MSRVNRMFAIAGIGAGEGVLIHKPSNIFYLSGYTGEGLLALGEGFQAIVTDFRYTEQAERQAPGWQVLMVEKGVSHAMLAAKLFAEHGVKAVRYEDDEVTVRAFEKLKKDIPGVEFAPLNGAPEKARRIKDEKELKCIEEACDISCRAFESFLPKIKPGMTEKQLQLILDYTMLELGGEALAFNTIVASGVNGSLPHAIPSDKKVEKGEMITFDFGAKKGGYCADMTRTVSLGQPSTEMKKIYDTVLRAQETCEQALFPGKVCKDIDTIAHEIIDAAGYKAASATAWATAWASISTRNPACPSSARTGWSRASPLPWSRASTCRALAGSALRTPASSPKTAGTLSFMHKRRC